MKRIPLTQGLYTLVDNEDYEYLNQWNWYAHKQGNTYYAKRTTSKDYKITIIHMHRVVLNISEQEVLVDHKDRNGLNNQKYNLRTSNKSKNGMNRPAQKNNSSGYKGVGFDKSRNKWKAQIMIGQKNKFIGRFDTAIDAAHAYDKFALELFDDFAYLNFPQD